MISVTEIQTEVPCTTSSRLRSAGILDVGELLNSAGMGALRGSKLQDIIKIVSTVKPRSLDWLLRVVESMYKAKLASDSTRRASGLSPLDLADVIFAHLSSTYGTKKLVNEYAGQVLRTILEHLNTRPAVTVSSPHIEV